MIAVDSNILVYAARTDSPWHQTAFSAVASLANSSITWAIPWPCVHEFLSVVTSVKTYDPPTALATALDQVDAWLASPSLILLSEGSGHFAALREVVGDQSLRGRMIHDAKIAALCIANGVTELWTADRDFAKFPALKVRNPLMNRYPTA